MIVFAMGSGRCGTMSLAKVLDRQLNSRVTHERWSSCMSWHCAESLVAAAIDDLKREQVRLAGDVAPYYLPYVDVILQLLPEAKLVCLKRDRVETVQSFLTVVGNRNHWTLHDGRRWQADPYWDKCFPKFESTDRAEAIGLYWDMYYQRAEQWANRLPRVFRIFPIDVLNDEAQLRDLLTFVGIPPGQQDAETGAHYNVVRLRSTST